MYFILSKQKYQKKGKHTSIPLRQNLGMKIKRNLERTSKLQIFKREIQGQPCLKKDNFMKSCLTPTN